MNRFFLSMVLLSLSFCVFADDDLTSDVFEDIKYENSPRAQYILGLMYLDGQGVSKDNGSALSWLRKSSDQGYLLALHRLGKLYRDGKVTKADPLMAVKHITLAAEKGYSPSQYLLGTIYQNGEKGVAKDKEKAKKWLSLAAEQDHKRSIALLAKILKENGFISDAQAAYEQGTRFLTGDGVDRDYKQAAGWFSKAAEQGHADAQYHLGELYNKGRGVKKNKKTAQQWYEAASAQGHVKAKYRTKGCAFC